ncbi:MAG: amidohydrolase [Pseudomonadota bacterium]
MLTENNKAADILLNNGRFFTLNDSCPWAEAVAIKDGRIVFVGTDREAAAHIGADTRVIDLNKRFVAPAFTDSHMHPVTGAHRYINCLALYNVHGEDLVGEYLAEAARFAQSHPEISWIEGGGFRRSAFDETGPRKEWLDRVEPRRPVSIISKDGHSMWVNSRALEAAGITARTPDPLNGVIQRDPATGEPTGLLQEAAMDPVKALIPKPNKDQVKKALLWLQEWLNREGITTVHDADLEIDSAAVYEAYQELAEQGRLTVRYRASWRLHPDRDYLGVIARALELSKKFTTPHFRADSFKFFADEVIEEETGFLLEPYAHRSDGWRGIKDWDDLELEKAFAGVRQGGGQVHVHAIGDGAIRSCLDVLEKVQSRSPGPDWRPILAHIQMAAPADIRRMADLGVIAVTAPYWCAIDDYFWDLYVPYLGRERAFHGQYPLKSLFDAGVTVAIHSDFSVTEPDVMFALYSALTRRLPHRVFERQFGRKPGYRWVSDDDAILEKGDIGSLPPAGERIGLAEALRAASLNGAYANHLEHDLGSIEAGKLADLTVLDRDPFESGVEDIPANKVVLTFFEGRMVYHDARAWSWNPDAARI